jgi:hypothetical protein
MGWVDVFTRKEHRDGNSGQQPLPMFGILNLRIAGGKITKPQFKTDTLQYEKNNSSIIYIHFLQLLFAIDIKGQYVFINLTNSRHRKFI